MIPSFRFLVSSLFVVLAGLVLPAQEQAPTPRPDEPVEVRLPNGRLQRDEILKADYARNVADIRELARLADELKTDLERQGQYVFSITAIKKAEEIEKLARRIRARMRRQ